MKRTNLVLDEHLLDEAKTISTQATYSAVVNEALDEYCRLRRVKDIYALQGSGIWEGNLSEMRRDYGARDKDDTNKKKP
ncbi:MAG: type II toxin-antitoxin system VapB family antitoxin [Leptospirales bacterium]